MIKNKLEVKNLEVKFEKKEILKNINMDFAQGEVSVIMGPNGSGKSTLANVLLGSPTYDVSKKSKIILNGKNIVDLETYDRARAGLFLAFQSPIAVSGVSVSNLLKIAYQSLHPQKKVSTDKKLENSLFHRGWKGDITIGEYTKKLEKILTNLKVDKSWLTRSVNEGFSGGEKKKIEMLQAEVLSPKYAIFDEVDTGLDVDSLRFVGKSINNLVNSGVGVIVITHYKRLLNYISPNKVFVLINGKVVKVGSTEIIETIENYGFEKYTKK